MSLAHSRVLVHVVLLPTLWGFPLMTSSVGCMSAGLDLGGMSVRQEGLAQL